MTELRPGSIRVAVPNSGLEVWLYDEANLANIREFAAQGAGGMPGNFEHLTQQGLVVGYSLQQDDDLDVAVIVGEPLNEQELTAGRWLEPQSALLRLPSGSLVIESNDASRLGPETATEKGSRTKVAAGDYRLTLYRIDHEALFRDGVEWDGPQEIIVLTSGGKENDAASDLLPHESRRTTDWVGRYKVDGRRADVLVWFDDYWDSFTVNIDSAGVKALALKPGAFIRTTVPDAGLTMISTFAKSWQEAEKLPLPSGVDLNEFGYAAVQRMGSWDSAEALFCKREKAKSRVEAQHQYSWLQGSLEVLDVQPAAATGRAFTATKLGTKQYFDDAFLAMVLSEVLPESEELDELPLKKAIGIFDKRLAKVGFKPVGDYTWSEPIRADTVDMSCRLYAGHPNAIAALMVSDGRFEIVFLSERADNSWILNGLADEMEIRVKSKDAQGLFVDNPRVQFNSIDEPITDIYAAHTEALGEADDVKPARSSAEETLAAFERFLVAAFD